MRSSFTKQPIVKLKVEIKAEKIRKLLTILSHIAIFRRKSEPRIIFLLNIFLCDVVIAAAGFVLHVLALYYDQQAYVYEPVSDILSFVDRPLTMNEAIPCYKEIVT